VEDYPLSAVATAHSVYSHVPSTHNDQTTLAVAGGWCAETLGRVLGISLLHREEGGGICRNAFGLEVYDEI